MTNAIGHAQIFNVGDLRRRHMKPVIPDLVTGRSEWRVSGMTNAIALAPIFNAGELSDVGDLRRAHMKSVIPDLVSERSERRVSGIHASTVGTSAPVQISSIVIAPATFHLWVSATGLRNRPAGMLKNACACAAPGESPAQHPPAPQASRRKPQNSSDASRRRNEGRH